MTAFSSGYRSLPRNTPSKKPYWKGLHGWMVISSSRQKSSTPPSRFTAASFVMLTFSPAVIIGEKAALSWSWLATSGWCRLFCSRRICIGFWLDTPKYRTFPLSLHGTYL